MCVPTADLCAQQTLVTLHNDSSRAVGRCSLYKCIKQRCSPKKEVGVADNSVVDAQGKNPVEFLHALCFLLEL